MSASREAKAAPRDDVGSRAALLIAVTRASFPAARHPYKDEPNMATRRPARAKRKGSVPDRDLERTYSPKQFAAKLRRLADALEAGRGFTIQVAGEQLRIPAGAEFNVEHERSGGEEELEFQLRWSRGAR